MYFYSACIEKMKLVNYISDELLTKPFDPSIPISCSRRGYFVSLEIVARVPDHLSLGKRMYNKNSSGDEIANVNFFTTSHM